MKSTIEFMKQFQKWRRFADIPMPCPTEVGIRLDALILAAERYEKLRRLNPRQFKEIYNASITDSGRTFDDWVDTL